MAYNCIHCCVIRPANVSLQKPWHLSYMRPSALPDCIIVHLARRYKSNPQNKYSVSNLSGFETGTVCMINIIVVGLIKTKLANLANTKVKREVLVVFINFSPLPVMRSQRLALKTATSPSRCPRLAAKRAYYRPTGRT